MSQPPPEPVQHRYQDWAGSWEVREPTALDPRAVLPPTPALPGREHQRAGRLTGHGTANTTPHPSLGLQHLRAPGRQARAATLSPAQQRSAGPSLHLLSCTSAVGPESSAHSLPSSVIFEKPSWGLHAARTSPWFPRHSDEIRGSPARPDAPPASLLALPLPQVVPQPPWPHLCPLVLPSAWKTCRQNECYLIPSKDLL